MNIYCIYNEHPNEEINKYIDEIHKYPNIKFVDFQKTDMKKLESEVSNTILLDLHSTAKIIKSVEKILVVVIGKGLPEHEHSTSYDILLYYQIEAVPLKYLCRKLDKHLGLAFEIFYCYYPLEPNTLLLSLRDPSYYYKSEELKNAIPDASFFERNNAIITFEFFTSLKHEKLTYMINYLIPFNKFLEHLSNNAKLIKKIARADPEYPHPRILQ
ncbi:MAG: hypothetical protein ACTSXP_07520 [Promethearchaeota archaeon]